MRDVMRAIKDMRKIEFNDSNQMSLGDLISKLEDIYEHSDVMTERYNHEPTVNFDFEYLFPVGIDSWRGSYDELAIGFATDGNPMTVGEFLNMLKDTVGKTLSGYKGGDFLMDEETPLWVANPGNAGDTQIVGVVDNEHSATLQTVQREY